MNYDYIAGRWIVIIMLVWLIVVLLKPKKMKTTICNDQGHTPRQRDDSYKIAFASIALLVVLVIVLVALNFFGLLP